MVPQYEHKEDERWMITQDIAARLRRSAPSSPEQIPRLRDTDVHGTPSPAAANPFIYKRGTGRTDEPPEEAGAPNIARVNRYRDYDHSNVQ
jgi:hypothetical protein